MSRNHFAKCAAVVALATLLSTVACNSASTPTSGDDEPGAVVARPDGDGFFFADPNRRGDAPELHLVDVRWGRLVDVFGLDDAGERVLMQEEFLINGTFTGDGANLFVETSPITGQQDLIVMFDVTDAEPGGGREQFFAALAGLDQNLARVPDAGLTGGAGLFTMIPRNATVMLRFDDLLDPGTIDSSTVRVATGVPAGQPFETRILVDRNHGGTADRNGDGELEVYPTRVYIDPTVSELEAFAGGLALPINNSGFPESRDSSLANLAIRVPTATFPAGGQTLLLQNLTAHPLDVDGNGTIDFSSPTQDITRVARTGGLQAVTGDVFNGFLRDVEPPRVIATLGVRIDDLPEQLGASSSLEFRLPRVTFDSQFCSKALRAGDVIRQQEVVAEVTSDTLAPSSGVLEGVHVRLRAFPPSFSSPADWLITAVGPATTLAPYDPQTDSGKEVCFVTIDPPATGGVEAPGTGVAGDAVFTFLFSEAMQRASFSAFDALRLTRRETPERGGDWTVGELDTSLSLREVRFNPRVPLAHRFGESERYYLSVSTEGQPPTDLAGNAVLAGLPPFEITLRDDEATRRNASRVLRFDRVDEEAPFGNLAIGEPEQPEFFGQHSYDLSRTLLRPRPVTRFEAVADRSQPAAAAMTRYNPGALEPLSPLGSKLQLMWRSVDFGFGLEDPTMYNVDVEGINWAPNGLPSTDHFNEFEIRLAHSRFLPDEYACGGIMSFPNSGVGRRFQENTLSPSEDPQVVMHPRSGGYSVDPGDLFTAASGTPMMPFPINQGASPSEVRTYTWRDTSLRTRGGDTTSGAPTFTEFLTRGAQFSSCAPVDPTQYGLVYPPPEEGSPVNIRTVALPLLVEFRCYPDDGASGLNAFDVSIARFLAIQPALRAHSTGGVSSNGTERRINPDVEATARGGFDHISVPSGQPTSPTDNISYMGSVDLVVRVSRSHSVWFLANEAHDASLAFLNPRYLAPVVEPRAEDQPAGTRLELAFRGATAVGVPESSSAMTLDAYGDHYDSASHSVAAANVNVAFTNGDAWRTMTPTSADPLGIDGSQYYQVRVTFFSDIHSGNRPELGSLAMAWQE